MNYIPAIVSSVATVFSLLTATSPIVTMIQLSKDQSVGAVPIIFFCAQYVNCNLWSMYGIFSSTIPLLVSNTLGTAIAVWCVLTYLTIIRLEEKSGHALQVPGYRTCIITAVVAGVSVALLLALLLFLVNFVSVDTAYSITGVLGGFTAVFMLSSPLMMAKSIIQKKNAEGLQPVTICCGIGNTVLWCLYGFLVTPIDIFLIIPNALCATACFFQVFLILWYGRRPSTDHVEVKEAYAPLPVD